jgi:hypothetical protein
MHDIAPTSFVTAQARRILTPELEAFDEAAAFDCWAAPAAVAESPTSISAAAPANAMRATPERAEILDNSLPSLSEMPRRDPLLTALALAAIDQLHLLHSTESGVALGNAQ